MFHHKNNFIILKENQTISKYIVNSYEGNGNLRSSTEHTSLPIEQSDVNGGPNEFYLSVVNSQGLSSEEYFVGAVSTSRPGSCGS